MSVAPLEHLPAHRYQAVAERLSPGGFPLGALGAFIAGAVAVAGCLLPWVSATLPFVGTMSRNATIGGDGTVALVLSVLLCLTGCARFLLFGSRTLRVLTALLGAAVVALGATLLVRATDFTAERMDGFPGSFTLGPGIWVLVIGGGVAIISALLDRV